MDNKIYKNILKLIIIANILFFSLSNIGLIFNMVQHILNLFFPFILGICIAFILNIPMKFFEKLIKKIVKKEKSARMSAIFITILVFIIIINLIISMIIPEIVGSLNELRINLPPTFEKTKDFFENPNNPIITNFSKLGLDFASFIDSIFKSLKDSPIFNTANTIQSIFSITTSVFSTVMNTFLGLIFAIYILSQKEKLISQVKALLLAVFGKKKSDKILDFFNIVSDSFAKFIAGQGTESTILALLFLISMTIFKLPKALPISAIIGVFSIIPLFGVMIAFVYAFLSILIVSPVQAMWFAILFIIVQQLEGNLIYPRVVGKSVGLPGILVLLSITVIGKLAGFLGMILAVPTMSVIYTLACMFVKKRTNIDLNNIE